MAVNLMQVAKQLMTSSGREQLANQMLGQLPSDTRTYLMKYKNNPIKGIEEGVKDGKITDKEIAQLRPVFEKARMFGVRVPIDKLNEIEQLAKSTPKGNNSNFKIF